MNKKIVVCSMDARLLEELYKSYNLIKLLRNVLKHNAVGLYIFQESNYIKDPHKIREIFWALTRKQRSWMLLKINYWSLWCEPDVLWQKLYLSV